MCNLMNLSLTELRFRAHQYGLARAWHEEADREFAAGEDAWGARFRRQAEYHAMLSFHGSACSD